MDGPRGWWPQIHFYHHDSELQRQGKTSEIQCQEFWSILNLTILNLIWHWISDDLSNQIRPQSGTLSLPALDGPRLKIRW